MSALFYILCGKILLAQNCKWSNMKGVGKGSVATVVYNCGVAKENG